MRRAIPFAILAGCLGVGVLPALAADTTVGAGASSWDPDRFAVKPGEQVTWRNTSGVIHNLTVDGTHVQDDGSAWTYGPQAYPARATSYEYHCTLHPGMSGRFYVNESGTVPAPTTTPNPSPDPSPTPAAYPTPTPTRAGGGGSGGTTPPAGTGGPAANRVSAFRASPTKRRFCTRRSATCPRPGVFLRLTLGASAPVRVRGTLRRGAKRVRAVSLRVRPGSRRVRLPGPRLKPGRYVLTLRAGDITRRLRFAVRAP
ncbi:MAG: Cupredoxin-like domain [Solirubrobacteraceae bacterium]|nr:Cupredoxin-like domain [Solirubrobacteraceae bacterium]